MLRPYQQRSIEMLYASMRENEGNPCLVLCTGAGKSHIVAALCKDALQNWPETRVLMLTHVAELLTQNAEKMRQHWPGAPLGIYSASLGRRRLGEPITFAGIQSVRTRAKEIGHIDLIIIDECHLVSHNDEGSYRKLIADLTAINPHLRTIGLTATPWRLGHGLITEKPAIFDTLVEPVTIEELLVLGHLAPLRSKVTQTRYDTKDVSVRGGDFVESELAAAVDTDPQNVAVVDEVIRLAGPRKAWLFFCSGVAHAEHIAAELMRRGVPAACVTGDTPKAERADILKRFKSGALRAVTNANVLTTGFDYPDIDLIAMLRPTKSPVLYVQCLDDETEVLTPGGWRKRGQVAVGDMVSAFDMETGRVAWRPVLSVVERSLGDEAMFGMDTPRQSIRVTAGHQMVVARRQSNQLLGRWQKMSAEDASAIGDAFAAPSAGDDGTPDDPTVTDDELRFVGWFLTDGTKNRINNAITIYQAEHQPQMADLVACLTGCGFRFGHHIRKRKEGDGGFKETSPLHVFTISHGDARRLSERHLRGWNRLARFIDKDLSPAFEALSRRQLGVLLEAIHLGDGTKSRNQGWERRSYHIPSVRPLFLERLQSLCVRRGFSANIAHQPSAKRLGWIHIKDTCVRMIGSGRNTSRPIFKQVEGSADETVWCVENDLGTLVTRRRGRVLIVGNCAGRGLRPKSHTDHCLVLDFAGVVETHGPITRVEPPRKKGNGEAPIKVCPDCGEICHASQRQCPGCGFSFPFMAQEPKPLTLRSADIMGDEPPETMTMPVKRWQWTPHTSKTSGKEMIAVRYYGGLSDPRVDEYLTVKHDGYAGEKAWRTVSMLCAEVTALGHVLPEGMLKRGSIDELCEAMSQTTPPATLRYSKDGKFFRVLERVWPKAPTVAITTPSSWVSDEDPWM